MPNKCCVKGCSFKRGHRFPNAEKKLRERWIHAVRREGDKKNKKWKPKPHVSQYRLHKSLSTGGLFVRTNCKR